MVTREILNRAIKKGKQIDPSLKYRVVAIGFSKKFDYIGMQSNTHTKFNVGRERVGGGHHSEYGLMLKHWKSLKYIFIIRVNPKGDLMPIDACKSCQKLADNLGIKIISFTS